MNDREGSGLLNRLVLGLSNLIRPVALLIVFALIPIAVIQAAFYLVDHIERERTRQTLRALHDNILSKIKAADDDAVMISRAIKRVFDRQCSLDSREQQAVLARRLERLYAPGFDLYLFDGENRLLPDLSIGKRPRRAVEMCFRTLQDLHANRPVSPASLGLAATVLNIPSDPSQMKLAYNFQKIGNREQDGYFEWGLARAAAPGTIKGFILLLHPGKFRQNRALENSIQYVNKRFTSLQVGMVDTMKKQVRLFPPELKRLHGLQLQLTNAAARYDQQFQTDTYFGTFIPREQPGYLVAFSNQAAFFSRSTTLAMHAVCVIWLLVVMFHIPAAGAGLQAKIPTKLMGLFLFAIGTPSFVLLLGGYYALKDHENVLMQNLELRVKTKLRVFDDTLPIDISRREEDLKAVITQIRATQDAEIRKKIFQKVGDMSAIDLAFIIDRGGTPVATARGSADDIRFDRQRKFTLVLARELLNRINKTLKIDSASLAVDAAEGFLGGIVGTFNLDQLSQGLGRFVILSLGAESSYVLFDTIFGREGLAENLVFIVMHRGKFNDSFLHRRIPELMKQPDLELTVSGLGEKAFLGSASFHLSADMPRTLKLAQSVLQTRNPMRLITQDAEYGRLWYALMGSNLGNIVLIATTSLKPVKERIQLLWMVLILLAILVFVSTLQIGRLLTEHFLEPIAALGEGMHAIEYREFQHKVPILSADEFGQLSTLMNHVLEGMQDLQVAKIVQESLFPGEPLDTGRYRIWGRSKAMADIGGDYYDYFMHPDGRLMGLVGDVSGHGVSAALIMGMAKCALTMEDRMGRGLVEAVTSFNRFLLASIKKKKMMTMFLYSLNPADNTLEFVNAGHNFPFLRHSKTGTVTQIGMESFPLGVRAKATYRSETISLEPGDSILFYTDGLVEAPGSENGELIGYEQAVAWFGELADHDPTETISLLFERFDAFTRGTPAADDISMICLKRLS